ncbi:MAG: putative MFS-type transporter YhjX [Smithella sp. PtaU1.Bin162]|nr:MAG: putative MFS-type transporter YhjX [Smithella sp. PtaU1.Bin162]
MKTKYFYGYNIVAAGFFIQAVSIGAMFTYGVFFKELQQEFGWSRALISGASSLAFFIMGAGAIIAGTLNDRIGPRIILTVSGISQGLGYLIMSQMNAPWQLYLLYGLFAGIGFSTHDVITLSTIARWFVKYRGMMSGIAKIGTGAGQFLVPLVATMLISSCGWRNAYLIIGGVVLVALVAVAQLMKRDPRKIGLLPDGNKEVIKDKASSGEDHGLSLREAIRTVQFWGICLSEFAVFFCIFTVIVHIVPHALDRGIKPAIAASVLSTIGAVSMVGRFVMGTINDKIGGKRSLITCFIIMIGGLILLQFAGSLWTFFLFAVVYGFAHGGLFTVMSPTIAEFFGMGSHGQLFGAVLFIGTIGATLGPIVTGYVFDISGEYRVAFMALTVFAIVGLIPIMFLRQIKGTGKP